MLLPYDPTIVLLSIYPNKLKTYNHTKTYMWMLTVALFTISQTWKQSKYLLPGKWINCGISQQWNMIHAKRNELSSNGKMWRKLKNAYQ